MITAVFSGSAYARATGLWQYDYGQILRIQGLSLPAAVKVDFSLSETGSKSVPRVGVTKDGVTDAPIPDSMLENGDTTMDYDIYAFVYIEDETSGKTTHRITMPVTSRPKPEAFDTPEDAQLFRDAIAAVNESAGRAEAAEKLAEAWAHGHEDYPEREQDNSKYYAGQAKDTAEGIRTDVQGMVEQATAARNIAIENANIAANMADETEADKQSTEANKAATAADKQATEENLAESNRILQEQIQMLGTVPMIYAVTTLEELQEFTGAKEGDFGIIQEPRAMLFRYYVTGADGQPLSQPAWQWMTDMNITFTRENLLGILRLAGIALSGSYNDLVDIPNRYNTPLVLDGTGEMVEWDYSQSDTAVVTLTENKPINITGAYNGCVAVIQCYGAQLDFSDATIYNKSATMDYIEPLEVEHITYTLIYNAGKWDVTAMVYAGGEAGE